MRLSDPRPARLYTIGGNTALALPRAYCRKLGLLPRSIVLVTLTADGCILVTPTELPNHAGPPVRSARATSPP